ncbi:MAG: SDR family oxidoreductase [Polynucleobacter sp.]|nr:SDR family oxidoreductase [Polynucleobacter sp.]
MSNIKILITGNLGYIGPELIDYLRKAYPKSYLIGLDAGFFAHCLLTNGQRVPEIKLDEQIYQDLRRIDEQIFEGIDAVVHLAGLSNDPMGSMSEGLTESINLLASISLAEKAKKAGVRRFIFASSCSIYGEADGVPKSESDELNPLTAYAKSKINFEGALKNLADTNFVATALRFATACGMSPRLRLDLVLNDFVASAISNKKIEILSDGTPWRPLIHIRDMARAIDWGICREAVDGGNFVAVNTGSNEWNYQVIDLAQSVADEFPGVELIINSNATKDNRSYKVNFSKFKNLAPDYQPLVTLKEAIFEIKEGLLKNQFSNETFRSSNLIRLFTLRNLIANNQLDNNLYWIP